MKGRRSRHGRVAVATMAPWLVRWLLLQDSHHKFGPPGVGPTEWIHVVCPDPACTTQDWVTMYEPETVDECGQHDGPRKPMIPCVGCKHPVPKSLR